MANATVPISEAAREKLQELAPQTGESMESILDKAIDEYRRRRFLEDANAAFAALRADPDAWREELEGRRPWEATLTDGLEGN